MAKATEGIPANHLTAKHAAAEIIALINSRPVSPWPHEIEAVIAGVVPAPASDSVPPHVVAYRAKAQEFYRHGKDVLGPLKLDAPNHDTEYERGTALGHQADLAGNALLDTPPTTWGDLIGLASIVAHEAGHDLDALSERRSSYGDPGAKAAEKLALAVLRFQAKAVPQVIPVDFELVRLISEWRLQRDIIDRTYVETAGASFEEAKASEKTIDEAHSNALNLAKHIWQRAKAETWNGGPVNPLTLAVLAEIALAYENGSTAELLQPGDEYADDKAGAELMVAVMSHARSLGVLSDLLPMEGRYLPPALLKGGDQ